MTYDSGCYALDSIQPLPITITFPGAKVYRFQSVLPLAASKALGSNTDY